VKLDAGFAGAEALRAVAADPPNRFKTLRVQGVEVPEYGAEVTKSGEPIGTLTSPADSPRFGVIGLAALMRITPPTGPRSTWRSGTAR
jgi:hypothetical protein